jgi:hypothetical protein
MRHINQFGKNTAAGGTMPTIELYKFISENMPEGPTGVATAVNIRFLLVSKNCHSFP